VTAAHRAETLVDQIALRLTDPANTPATITATSWWRQSLAHGAPGIALLHIERAARGLASWQPANAWLTFVASSPVTSGRDSHLFHGAPALAHALACAATSRPGRSHKALAQLDRAITEDVVRRVDDAHRRMDDGGMPTLAEFDAIRGLSGLGAYLLRRDTHSKAVRCVLEYLVRLTEPLSINGEILPGWWVTSGPSGRPSERFAGGHGNTGMAHGIAGPLALLALALRHGVTVDGHQQAMMRILAWLDRWRAPTATGPVWPYWVNRQQLRVGRREISDAQPPSWCYGTAGLARAQQLAALALGDTQRGEHAATALFQAVSSLTQLGAATDASLCHGIAGLAHIAAVVAADASPQVAEQLRGQIPELLDKVQPPGVSAAQWVDRLLQSADVGAGLLEGAAGIALAVMGAEAAVGPSPSWDTCLLIT
jgi:hypothetical protein